MDSLGRIELSANKCFELFDQSFNRVKYFLCISDNVCTDSLPSEWRILNESGMNYGVHDPAENTVHLIDGYKFFIRRYLVRDVIESFALCLDKLCFLKLLDGKTLTASQSLRDALTKKEKSRLNTFEFKGLKGKLEILEADFGLVIPEQHADAINSLTDIRNCFAHNNGYVRPNDGLETEEGKREFQWLAFSLFLEGASGREYEVVLGEPLQEESNVCLRLERNTKAFKISEPLSFSSVETYEIALSLHLAATEYLKSVASLTAAS